MRGSEVKSEDESDACRAEREAVRRGNREAMEYIERTGASYYCLHCHGECTPEHLATLQ